MCSYSRTLIRILARSVLNVPEDVTASSVVPRRRENAGPPEENLSGVCFLAERRHARGYIPGQRYFSLQ